MNKITKTILALLGCAAFLFVAYFMGLNTLLAKAASLVFKTNCYTASATTTLSYMSIGTATTTVTCPMGDDGADTASLAIQVNASSTLTTYAVYVEESMDGLDWYPIPMGQSATTTNPFTLTTRPYSTFTFASSTIGGSGAALYGASTTGTGPLNARNHYLIDVPVRMKRVRAYSVLPVPATYGTGLTGTTSYNGAVWMQIIPKIGI